MSRNRSVRRLLVTFGLFIAVFALSARPAFATHFRYATIYWTRDLTYSNPQQPTLAKVSITIQIGERWTYPGYTYPTPPPGVAAPTPNPSVPVAVACAGVVTASADMLAGASCPPVGAWLNPGGGSRYGVTFSQAVTIVGTNGVTLAAPIAVTASSTPTSGLGYQFSAVVTQVLPTQDTFYAVATLDVLVDTSTATLASPLLVSWEDSNRLSTLLDGNNDIPWLVQTPINLAIGNTKSPVSVSSAVIPVAAGVQNVITLPVQTFDNTIAHYRLATSAESQLTAPQPSSPSVFSLDPQTGQVLFTPRTLGFYGVQFKVSAVDANGIVQNEVPLDLIFQAVAANQTYSVGLATGDGQTTYTATAAQPMSFTVDATLAPSNPAYTVTINSTVLPTGATFTQGNRVGNAPAIGTFNWTPTVNSSSSSVCFTATATNGQVLVAQSGSFCVSINLNPLATVLTAFPASGDGGGPLMLSAKLTRQIDNAPLPGRSVNFTWNNPANVPWVSNCLPALTDSTGIATCVVQTTHPVASGAYIATFNAISNELLQSSAAAGTVVIKRATTTLSAPTTPTTPYNSVGYPLTVSGVLNRVDLDGGVFPPPGQIVLFTLTDPNGVQTALNAATAGTQGVASVTFAPDAAPVLGIYTVSTSFAGNDLLFGGVTSPVTTFAMKQRLKLTPAASTGGVNTPTVLSAQLTDIPQGTPVAGRTVTFTVGTTTLQSTTDVNGNAQVVTTFQNVGTFSFTASTTPIAASNEVNSQGLQAGESATGAGTNTPAAATTLTVAPFSGTSWTPAALIAQLTSGSPATSVAGQTVTFSIAGVTVGTAVTGVNGMATLSLTPDHKVTAQYSAAFAGQAGVYLASSSTSGYAVANAASSTVIACSPATFTGNPVMPCTATVTGAGGLSQPVVASYTSNVNAGTASASASFAGDASHDPSSASTTFAIAPAVSATVVTCPTASTAFTGAPLTPCSATVTGVGGLSQSLTVTYANNVNAGGASATASFAGDANHASSSDSATFTIAQAASTTVVTCPTTSVAFTGAAQTPCSATVTGAGGLSQPATVTYANNVSAGSASATASFAGDANHGGSTGTTTFTIGLASTTTVVTCPPAVTFTGAAQTPCSATVTGDGGFSQSLTVTYASNVSAGSASATASFAGDANHSASNGSATFTIGAATSATVVTCSAPVTFNGSAQMPCSATVTGDGGLSQPVPVTYANNVSAGSASATASFAGDANHAGSSGSATFTIGLAPSTIAFTCPTAPVTFNGSAQTPCTATASGDGGLSQSLTVSYANNTVAGIASATASYAGDTNHASSTGSATFAIGKAASTTTVSCPAGVLFNGSAETPCMASAAGSGGLAEPLSVTYGSNTNVGTASASATFAGDANHDTSSGSVSFAINPAVSVVTLNCPVSATFTGNGQTPCTATVTGDGGLSQAATVSYTGNVSAGTASATASYAGDVNHASGSGSASFTIGKAPSTTTVSCPAGVTFNGGAETPCSANATGAGGLTQAVSVTYSANTTVGTASASANFAGDANHDVSSGSTSFAINPAVSAVTVSCPVTVTFTGAAQTPCTATVAGDGGLNQTLAVSYTSNTVAGTASATASYAGDANHASGAGSASFAIGKASSATVVTCPAGLTFNGSAQTPCSANATGAGGLTQAVSVTYSSNTAVGTASASANFQGDANHDASSGSANFAITVGTSVVTITCPASVTFTGGAQTPCTATVSGAGGLSQTLTANYTSNVNAGTASASASYAGDANHAPASSSATFAIAKAASAVAVSCPASVVYSGSAQSPCTAAASGAGGLSQAVSVSYANNTNVGTASASASFAGDANHAGSTGASSFAITARTPVITWAAPAAINQGTKLSATQLNATASVPGKFVYSPVSGTVLGPGTQTLSVTFTPTDQVSYTTATATVSITVNATGNVSVGPGQTVTFSGGTVKQNVTVEGGTLILTNGAKVGGQVIVLAGNITTMNSTIDGNLSIGGPSTFAIGPGTVVDGNLLVGLMPQSSVVNSICGAHVDGNIDYGAAGAGVTIGAPAAGCAGNVVTGQLMINLTDAPVQVFSNQIGKQLQCSLNKTITGGGNTAQKKQGQCSAF